MRELLARIGAQEWTSVLQTGLHIGMVVLLAWLLRKGSIRLIAALRDRMAAQSRDPERTKRMSTLVRVLQYVTSVGIVALATMLVLAEFGLSIAPLLAAAGVAGIAVGFGAQSLVKDYFTGIVMLLEDQARVGDVVEAAGKTGLVEQVTLRYLRLRDYDGNVHYVPNGAISTVTNRSRGFAYAVIDVGVSYDADLDEVMQAMRDVGAAMRREPELADRIEGDLEIAGIQELGDSSVVVRSRFKVQPNQQMVVRRAALLRLKRAFDARGIEIPFPQVTLHRGAPLQAPEAGEATRRPATTLARSAPPAEGRADAPKADFEPTPVADEPLAQVHAEPSRPAPPPSRRDA